MPKPWRIMCYISGGPSPLRLGCCLSIHCSSFYFRCCRSSHQSSRAPHLLPTVVSDKLIDFKSVCSAHRDCPKQLSDPVGNDQQFRNYRFEVWSFVTRSIDIFLSGELTGNNFKGMKFAWSFTRSRTYFWQERTLWCHLSMNCLEVKGW